MRLVLRGQCRPGIKGDFCWQSHPQIAVSLPLNSVCFLLLYNKMSKTELSVSRPLLLYSYEGLRSPIEQGGSIYLEPGKILLSVVV